jgi:simple sugar transport system substrate-binding protein
VKFEHCTGFKRADNVATYNSKFHEGRAVLGTISGMQSKSGTLGYLGSYKVPEVVLGVNSFALSAQKKNPDAKVKLVFIDSWFDPPKEAAATETLVNLGCDIVTTHTDSPAALQILEQKGLFGFGQGADMSTFAPNAHLTAIEDIWGPYYVQRAQELLDGKWASADTWDGFKEGTVVISPYNKNVTAEAAAEADKIQAGYKDGTFDIFTGPIYDQDGNLKVEEGKTLTIAELAVMDWFVKGVESAS